MNYDLQYLENTAYPLLKGITQFIINRAYFNNNTKKYEWRNVCPPDEYHVCYIVSEKLYT